MNKLLNGLNETVSNIKLTENGGLAHNSTMDKLYDLFALGGAYRSRSDDDCIFLFKKAFEEYPVYALKCLFYLRDCRGGQGERRFFRVCMKWLANTHPDVVVRNLEFVPIMGRWDDLYIFVGTKVEEAAFALIKKQLELDMTTKTNGISLLAKWMKSCNTSSAESCALGEKTRRYLGMTQRQYRKMLSILRGKINVLEKLMSEGRWNEIDFEHIPSRAGIIYRNAFARRDMIKAKYEAFAKSENTKVNAGTLYPYEVVANAIKVMRCSYAYDATQRAIVNKYWGHLSDYFNGCTFNGLAVVDTSGSMRNGWNSTVAPIDVAISLGMYCAEKAKGPFAGNYISFSRTAKLIKVEGVDFCDKVKRIYDKNLCENTNLESVFELLLNTAQKTNCKQEDMPESIIIISDMEIDEARGYGWGNNVPPKVRTMMENMRLKWQRFGYKLPNLVYWNVNARNDTILDDGPNVTYVSGASPVIFQQIMSGKTGVELMLDKLNSSRYSAIK